MSYFQLSIFAAITGTLSVLLIYVYLYILYRERFMGLWIISWTIFFCRVIFFDSRLFNWKESLIGSFSYQLIYITCCYLFIYGTHVFINRPLTKYWLYSVLITLSLSIATIVSQLSLPYRLIPPTLFATIILIYVGQTFIKIKTRGVGKYITGTAFFLWGFFTALIPPFYAYDNELPWWISLICGISRLFIASGILMVYFEKTRADLINNEETLRRTNKELNNFCHSVAHDLKSPLLSIHQLANELERADNFNQEQRELTQYIKEKSAELVKITDHLLELSRMSQKQLQIESIQLEPLFRDIYEELIMLHPNRKVDFILKRLPQIYGDRIMMKLLVRNILSNALKYTRNREPAIIEVNTEETQNDYIISVKDNGAGFDMRYASRLFGVFERLHSNNEFEGCGVGLAISQKILQRHHGKAWLAGKVDEGAVFSFSFPKDMQKHHSWPMLILPDSAHATRDGS